ncbi:MAG TPA: glycosyltransferase, partial [Nocardioides sp.]|nr:glycosyltransferase [Nocardioides sp.]
MNESSHDALGRVVMVVPTYNEADNLGWVIGRLRAAQPSVDVLVVDDNSPDGTGALASELATADPAVHVLHRAGKGGLGAAYLAGFAWAL